MFGASCIVTSLPIGSADSADAEREKRTQRLGKIVRRIGQLGRVAFAPGGRPGQAKDDLSIG